MKSASKSLTALAVVLAAVGVASSAHAFEVQYSYPQQVEIETRTVVATHRLSTGGAGMMMASHIEDVITFTTASSKLDKAGMAAVQHVASLLKSPAFAGKHIVVTGYTDNVGKAAGNQRLSYHRALSVVHALVAKGVPASSLSAEGSGEANPVATNSTAEGRAANRRVTFSVVCK